MWITHTIVKSHDGEISVSSEGISKGTTFTLKFDAFRQLQEEIDPAMFEGELQVPSLQLRSALATTQNPARVAQNKCDEAREPSATVLPFSLRILIVDDVQTCRKVLGNPRPCCSLYAYPQPSSHRALLITNIAHNPTPITCSFNTIHIHPHLIYLLNPLSTYSSMHICVLECPDIRPPISLYKAESCRRITMSELTDAEITCVDDGVTATHKVEALRLAGLSFDVIFMDNTMVHMNGPEAARAIRATGNTALIIGVTGNIYKEDVDEFMAAGADRVLSKPVNKQELLAVFNEVLARKRMEAV